MKNDAAAAKKLKKLCVISLLLSAALLLLFPASVFAHAGRTDNQGGHVDHSTGEYHFHHGRPAHQHLHDICPYLYAKQFEADNHTLVQNLTFTYSEFESAVEDAYENGYNDGYSDGEREEYESQFHYYPLIILVISCASIIIIIYMAAALLRNQ